MFSASIVKLPGFFSYLWTLSAELQTSQKATTEVPDKARNIANAELLLDRLSFFTVYRTNDMEFLNKLRG
jgi:hypothetical protein